MQKAEQEELMKKLADMLHFMHVENKGKKIEVKFTEEANRVLDAIVSDKKDYILETSKIMAIGEDYRKPMVTQKHLQWAMNFVESLKAVD